MLTLLALAPAALADAPLLHDGSTAEAVELAVEQGAGPAWELDPMRTAQLLPSDRPGIVGVESACARAPASSAELRTTVTLALARIQHREWEAADGDLAVARAMLACLAEETGRFDRIIGCIPQVLSPDPEALSSITGGVASDDDLYALSNYCSAQGFVEDQFGLGLIARAVEDSVDLLRPTGKIVFNIGGRPGRRC